MKTVLVIAGNVEQFREWAEKIAVGSKTAKWKRNDTVLMADNVEYVFVHAASQLYGPKLDGTTVKPLFRNFAMGRLDVSEKETLFDKAVSRFPVVE